MSVLLFGPGEYDRLASELLDSEVEQCAVLLAAPGVNGAEKHRLIVRKRVVLEPNDYSIQTSTRAILRPSVVARTASEALREESLVPSLFIHTRKQ